MKFCLSSPPEPKSWSRYCSLLKFFKLTKELRIFLKNLQIFKTALRFKFVSFDIKNLFPSLSLNQVIDIAAELLLNKFETISKDEIKRLLKFCTEYVSFQFGAVLLTKQWSYNGIASCTYFSSNIFIKF